MTKTTKLPSQPLARLTGHTAAINALTYSAGAGQYILTGSSDRNIHLYNPSKAISFAAPPSTSSSITARATAPPATVASDAGLIQRYSGVHAHEILTLAVASDNASFASGGGDRAVFLWDVATGRTLRRFGASGPGGHAGRVEAVAYGGAGDTVLCRAGCDATVRVWDLKAGGAGGGRPVMVLGEARDSVTCLSVEEGEIWAGGVDGRVRGYDIRNGSCCVDVVGDPITSLTPTTDRQTHLLSTLTSTLILLDRATGRLLRSYSHPKYKNTTYRVRSTLSAPNDGLVVAGDEYGTGGVRAGSKACVGCVAWRRGRKEWASAGGDGTVVVWGVGDGAEEKGEGS